MIKFGVISKLGSGPQKAMAKVLFQELDVNTDEPSQGTESCWMAVMQGFTLGAKAFRMPRVGTLVGCLMDQDEETGLILGCRYNAQDTSPDVPDATDYLEFEDGTTISYDPEAHLLTAQVVGAVDIQAIGRIRAQSMEGLEFSGAGPVTIDAADDMQLSASGKVTISAFDGVVVNAYGGCTVISDNVVSITAPSINLIGAVTITGSLSLGGNFTMVGAFVLTGNTTQTGTHTATEVVALTHPLSAHTHADPQGGLTGGPIP